MKLSEHIEREFQIRCKQRRGEVFESSLPGTTDYSCWLDRPRLMPWQELELKFEILVEALDASGFQVVDTDDEGKVIG